MSNFIKISIKIDDLSQNDINILINYIIRKCDDLYINDYTISKSINGE